MLVLLAIGRDCTVECRSPCSSCVSDMAENAPALMSEEPSEESSMTLSSDMPRPSIPAFDDGSKRGLDSGALLSCV